MNDLLTRELKRPVMSAVSMEYTGPSVPPASDAGNALSHIYQDYFGLKENPFAITPDPRYLYMSPRHREALAHLIFAVKQGGGFVQLTGEVGTGKTTLTRAMLGQLPENVTAAIVLNPNQSATEFVQSICDELRVPGTAGVSSIKTLTDALNAFLLEAHTAGRRTVVLIDEAQNLAVDVLEQIRLLTNLETSKEKLLQIVLIGQPELRVLLDRKDLRQLAQRVTARYHLLPLTQNETVEMVKHRLSVAGRGQPLFDDSALRLVHRFSNGVPRLINVICDRALLGAYAENRQTIDRRVVMRAATEVTGTLPPTHLQKPLRWAIAAVVLAMTASVATFLYRENATAPRVDAPAETAVVKNQISEATVAAPATTASVESVSQTPSLLSVLNDSQSRTDLDLAMASLFELWSLNYRAAAGIIPCERAQSAGLNCFRGKGNFAQLRNLNHAAVLKLVSATGTEHYAVLVALDGNTVALSLNGKLIHSPQAEIEPYWSGEYVMLWRRPAAAGNALIAPGTAGSAVRWLNNALNRIEGQIEGQNEAETTTVFFDEALTSRLKTFQKDHGLAPDGIAGEQTLIALIAASGESPVPRLF